MCSETGSIKLDRLRNQPKIIANLGKDPINPSSSLARRAHSVAKSLQLSLARRKLHRRGQHGQAPMGCALRVPPATAKPSWRPQRLPQPCAANLTVLVHARQAGAGFIARVHRQARPSPPGAGQTCGCSQPASTQSASSDCAPGLSRLTSAALSRRWSASWRIRRASRPLASKASPLRKTWRSS